MKKSIVQCCFFLLLANIVFGQGIVFEHSTWEEALAKAKKENKVLFIDIYTAWCAPCKEVAKTIFPQEKIGNYYNQYFINYQLDGEKGVGPAIVKKYGVNVYPTFLYVNGDGKLLYRFSGAKDVKGFLEEAEKVTICTRFGGWDKMQTDYKAGSNNPDFLWAYYELAAQNQKPEILNKYLKSLPDIKFFTVDVGKMMENEIPYDYDLMKRIIEGRLKLGEQAEDFDFFFTSGSQRLLSNYLDQSIDEGRLKWFEELLELKKKYNELPHSTQSDVNMLWGWGSFFSSEEFLRLRYMHKNGNNDDLYSKSLEAYIENLIKEHPLDSIEKKRKRTEERLKESLEYNTTIALQLEETHQFFVSYLINFIDYYWRMMPSDKITNERCAAWVNYICKMNPYNPDASLSAAGLLCRLQHKKDAIQQLEISIEKQKMLQKDPQKLKDYQRDKYAKCLRLLKNKLRDVKNDKE